MHYNLQRIFSVQRIQMRCNPTQNNPLQKSTQHPEMTTTEVCSVIPNTAETSALISDECFILWTELGRLPHSQTLLSEVFPLI